MTLLRVFDWLAVAAALSAAGLWFYASIISVPMNISTAWGGTIVGVKEMADAFEKQGFWNSLAAAMTGLAVLLELVAKTLFRARSAT